MSKILELSQPKAATMPFRGTALKFKYVSNILTDAYIDEYGQLTKTLADPSVLSSKKMALMVEYNLRRIVWIDLQNDDGSDMTVKDALEKYTWDELNELDQAIVVDIYSRHRALSGQAEGIVSN